MLSSESIKLTEQQFSATISDIYQLFYSPICFKEIDHVMGEIPQQMIEQINKSKLKYTLPKSIPSNKKQAYQIFVADDCLVISESFFDTMYKYLFKSLRKTLSKGNKISEFELHCADILSTMNGENQQVWNIKKTLLRQSSQETIKLDIKHQLDLNAAILMKFKKSSSCYQFRFELMENLFNSILDGQKQLSIIQLERIYQNEFNTMKRVLNRYYRNYFCWMYRLRLIKLYFTNFLPSLSDKNNREIINLGFDIFSKQIEEAHWRIEQNPNDHSAIHYLLWLKNKKYEIWKNILSKPESPVQDINQFLETVCEQKQKNWSQKFMNFCETAYDSQSSYKQFLKYHVSLHKK